MTPDLPHASPTATWRHSWCGADCRWHGRRFRTIVWEPGVRVDLLRLDGRVWVRITTPGREHGAAVDRVIG